jgi:hypothetical protein
MTLLAHLAAAIFALLGSAHLALALHDCLRPPRFFRPSDEGVLREMRLTRTALAESGRDYWSGVIGFNLSHAIGVLLFATLIVIASIHVIDWLKPALVLTGVVYAVVSFRCWFIAPTLGISLATLLLATAWFA